MDANRENHTRVTPAATRCKGEERFFPAGRNLLPLPEEICRSPKTHRSTDEESVPL